ncbi:MAG: PP2C family protein-serine/threonine phosphatase [Clostridiales bacterium]|nr:PP2C family protein-serine/threonine phosphatase [Clostridiales bacterium]
MLKKSKTWKMNLFHFIIAAVIFLAVTMPFRWYTALMEVTEIRPVAALTPFFGMVFGFWGALGCAVGNLAADLLSGYSLGMSLLSVPIQFLMGMLPYVLWYHIPARNGEKPSFPRMDKTEHVIKYMLIILVNSAVTMVLLGLVMQRYGIAEVFSQTTFAIFLNNLDFSYVLGLPLLTLAAVWKGYRFSLNERLILFFLLLAILAGLLIGNASWSEAVNMSKDRLYIWNHVCMDVAVVQNLFMLLELLFLVYIEKRVTIPIQKLAHISNDYVKEGGEKTNLQQFVDACQPYVDNSMEVGHLARSYVRMVTDLEAYMENLKNITAEKEKIGAELNIATQIQADMLPGIFPAFPGRQEFDIYATMTPAKEVGGDFYDFFLVDEDHLAMVVADVSGKGVPAALFMVIAKTLIKNRAQMGDSPAQVLMNVNEQLCEGNDAELFVTVWLGILQISTGKGVAANAGHEHPAVRRGDGSFELVKYRHSPPVAFMEDVPFEEHEFELHPGDCLYVYTDGVAEATNRDMELFGVDRMLQALNRKTKSSPEELLHTVKGEIDQFVGDAPQFDDITMLCLDYSGAV